MPISVSSHVSPSQAITRIVDQLRVRVPTMPCGQAIQLMDSSDEDPDTPSDYAAQACHIMDVTSVGFALALFKDTKMLDVLLAASEPMTSQEVAAEGKLRERYVRDILNSLATAELLHVSTNAAGCMVYHLEAAEKEVFQTRVWSTMSFFNAIFQVYDRVKDCVPRLGPSGFEIPEVFHVCVDEYYSHLADDHKSGILMYTPLLRLRLVDGIKAAEVVYGTSRLLSKFAEEFPKSTFSGLGNTFTFRDNHKIDHTIGNIEHETYELWSNRNSLLKKYDWIYCVNVMHKVPHPQIALSNIKNLMKPGGFFTMIESSASGNPVDDQGDMDVAGMYALSTFFCLPESLYQDMTGQALGMCWGKAAATDMLRAAGFFVSPIDLGQQTTLYVCH